MERSEEIPKTEPAEEIIEAKIEIVSGTWINIFSIFLCYLLIIQYFFQATLKEDESAKSRFELSPIEISEIIQSLIENPGANFGATAKKFAERNVFRNFQYENFRFSSSKIFEKSLNRFQKNVTHAIVYELYQDWCKRVNSSNCSTSNFVEYLQVL